MSIFQGSGLFREAISMSMSCQGVLLLSFMSEHSLGVVRQVWAWGPWASTVIDHYCTWAIALYWWWSGNSLYQIPFHSAWEQALSGERRSMRTYFLRLVSFPQSQGVWVFSFGLLFHFVSWASLSDRQVVNWPGTSRNIPTSHPSWIVYMWPSPWI